MAFAKQNHVVCVYTSACEELWAALLAQTSENQLGKPMKQQQHKPFAFLDGTFNGAESNWMTYEIEAYAVVQTFERLENLF